MSIYLYASIETTNKGLITILKSMNQVNSFQLKLKDRDFGYEVEYHDKEVYIYAYGNELEEKDGTMLLEGEFKQSIDEVGGFINSLKEACEVAKVPYYSFEYGEGDGEGNDIGEWYEVRYEE